MANSEAHNETRSQGPLRVALVAREERAAPLTAAVDACLLLQPLAQTGAALPDVPRVADPRLLLTNTELEALILAGSRKEDLELAGLAMERGVHVWRLPPLARSFSECTELLRRQAQVAGVQRVASWWEYVGENVWHELQWPGEFHAHYSELRVSAAGPGPESWRSRSAEAFTGVLTQETYPLLEALVAVRGLPDTVFACVGNYRRSASGGTRETEDTAVALLRYADGGTALIRAAWDLAPAEQQLTHFDSSVRCAITLEEVVLTGLDGAPVDQHPMPSDFLIHDLTRFVEVVRTRARERLENSLRRHLAVSAVLEAAYLSARTGHPETPCKFYDVAGWPEPRA